MNIFLLDFASNAIFIAKYILYEVLQLMVTLISYVIDYLIYQGFNYCDKIAFTLYNRKERYAVFPYILVYA